MISVLLLVIGLILILLEFYLPGGIMGVLGGSFVLASVVNFAWGSPSLWMTALFVLGAIVLITLLIRFALWHIVHAAPKHSIYLNTDQSGYQASQFDESAIGKKGVVLSDLKPGGYILIDDKQHQALSLTGYISKGESVLVVSGQEESLLVKPYSNPEHVS